MPNSNYRRGARLERLWIIQKKRAGYNATRSAGSKGLIDCIAWNDKEIIFAQLKASGAYDKHDLEKLRAMSRPPGSRVILAERVGAGGVEWNDMEC